MFRFKEWLREKLLKFLLNTEVKIWCKEIDLRKELDIKEIARKLNQLERTRSI